jgi:hypothetical protein
VTFYGRDGTDDDDVRFDSVFSDPQPTRYPVRARVPVTGRTLLNAEAAAVRAVDVALDWVALRCGLSEAFVPFNDGSKLLTWHRAQAVSRAVASSFVFCRREADGAYWVRNIDEEGRPATAVNLDDHEYFGEIFERCNELLAAPADEPRAVRTLLRALHWYRRAQQDQRPVDKLIDYWTSIEFIIAGERPPSLFREEDLARIIASLESDGWVDDSETWARLKTAIARLNEAPVPVRLSGYLTKYRVPVGPEEASVLESTRKMRNQMVHGSKMPDIGDYELRKLRSVVGKMLLRRGLSLNATP